MSWFDKLFGRSGSGGTSPLRNTPRLNGADARCLLPDTGSLRAEAQLNENPARWLTLYDGHGKGHIALVEGMMLTDDVAFPNGSEWGTAAIGKAEQFPFVDGSAAYLVGVRQTNTDATLLLTFADGALDIKLCVPVSRTQVQIFNDPFRVRVASSSGATDYALPNPQATKLKAI